jgi:hypothetical protein
VFVKAISEVLQPVKQFCVSFVDDMGVGSNSWNEHLSHLSSFLTVIRSSGITLNLTKTEFAKPQVKFVGHMVGSGTKSQDPDKVSCIRDLERPYTRQQLRQKLGLMGYYRNFVPRYAEIAKPLTDLTSNKSPKNLPWREVEQLAFDTLKDKLCQATQLHVPRIGELFVLRTDASGIAVAGALSQLIAGAGGATSDVTEKGDGEMPIAFCSQKLTATQQAWSTIEREAYAVIFALKKWHYLIFGAPVVVFSDHNPLTYIVSNATNSAKLTRWSLALQEYNITFRYAKGRSNIVADCLSRP